MWGAFDRCLSIYGEREGIEYQTIGRGKQWHKALTSRFLRSMVE